jgi:hypothetical protein
MVWSWWGRPSYRGEEGSYDSSLLQEKSMCHVLRLDVIRLM